MSKHIPSLAYEPLGAPADHQAALADEQVAEALERLSLRSETQPRVPWDSLHDILGPIWPDDFWVVAAHTGNGKSSLLMQLVDAWARERKRVYMLPLEQPASRMRLVWAALACDLDPQQVLESRLTGSERDAVTTHLRWQQAKDGGRGLVTYSKLQFVGEAELHAELNVARDLGAQIIVIDHIHRLDVAGSNAYQALVRLCQLIKEAAKGNQIPIIAAAQLHRDKEHDRLAPYLPPKPTAIQGGEVIRQECDVAFGLYRPLLATFSRKEAQEYRGGRLEIEPYLEPDRMGVHVLKHRIRGNMLCRRLQLVYRKGRAICAETEDRLAFEKRNDL